MDIAFSEFDNTGPPSTYQTQRPYVHFHPLQQWVFNKMYVMQDNAWGTFINVFNPNLKICIMYIFYNAYNISIEWVIITQALINILCNQ